MPSPFLAQSGLLQPSSHRHLQHLGSPLSLNSRVTQLQRLASGGGCLHTERPGSALHNRSCLSVPCCAVPPRSGSVSSSSSNLDASPGPGFNEKGKKTLEHPDYPFAQRMWHPTRNQGTQPADYTFGSRGRVWMLCPACLHGCGRQHEWETTANKLTLGGGRIVCPFCESQGGRFCPCRSVAADARLSREFHSDNPPPESVPIGSGIQLLWKCPKGHLDYKASCDSRSTHNTGCPVCGAEGRRTTRHPVLSEGRPDLAREWNEERNEKSASDVTLGSRFKAWWNCIHNSEHPSWQARVDHRALGVSSCPECAKTLRFQTRQFGPA